MTLLPTLLFAAAATSALLQLLSCCRAATAAERRQLATPRYFRYDTLSYAGWLLSPLLLMPCRR